MLDGEVLKPNECSTIVDILTKVSVLNQSS